MTDDLKNFQIKDRVPQTGPAAEDPQNPNSPSVGFPHIESLLESNDLNLEGFDGRNQQLEQIANSNAPARERGNANKAAKSYQRTRELLEQLLGIKSQMLQSLQQAEESNQTNQESS
jgi:hypothetical protein